MKTHKISIIAMIFFLLFLQCGQLCLANSETVDTSTEYTDFKNTEGAIVCLFSRYHNAKIITNVKKHGNAVFFN